MPINPVYWSVDDVDTIATTYAQQILKANRELANTSFSQLYNFVSTLATLPPMSVDIPDLSTLAGDITEIINQLYNTLSTIESYISSAQISDPPSFNDTQPGSPSLSTLPDMPSITIPEFSDTPPQVDIPTIPDIQLPDAPQPPTLEEYQMPTSPTLNEPTPPTMISVHIPDVPVIDLPEKPEIPESIEIPAVDVQKMEYSEAPYTSEFKDTIVSKLTETNYGIDPDIEEQLWNRERDRLIAEYNTRVEDIMKTFSLLGYKVPNGILQQMMNRVRDDYTKELSAVNRDIATKRADLYSQARQYTIDKYIDLEKTAIALFNETKNRLLQANKAIFDSAVSCYNLSLERSKALLQTYTAYVEIYRNLIQGELVKLENYKAQVQAEVSKQEVNRTLVELYNAQYKALDTKVNLYRASVEAVAQKYQAQRYKAEVYSSLVNAYRGQIDVQTAIQGAYRTKIEGEIAKVKVYDSSVASYNALVQAIVHRLNAEKIKIDAVLDKNKLEIANYDIKSRMYSALIDKYKAQLTAWNSKETLEMDKTKTAIASAMDILKNSIAIASARVEMLKTSNALLLDKAKLELQAYSEDVRLRTHSNEVLSQVYGGLVQASIGATHAVAQLQDSSSRSANRHFGVNISDSYSRSESQQQIQTL